MTTDENLKSTWVSIFLRKGASGVNTRLWDDCDEARRTALFAGLDLMSGELPVLVSGTTVQTRLVLTTRRLVHGATDVPIEHIAGVEPVDFAKRAKSRLSALQVATVDSKTVRIEIESGPPYMGLWNVLLHIASKNVRSKSPG
jgi:hypothetical protein